MATILARKPGSLHVFPQSATNVNEAQNSYDASSFVTDPTGARLFVVTPNCVDVLDGTGANKLSSIPEAGVVLAALSPAGNFLVTCQKPSKEEGNPAKNMKVWDLASGQCVLQLPQKQVTKDTWPVMQWAADDSCVANCVTNTVHVYSRADGFASYRKVTIKGIGSFAISPSEKFGKLLCAFIPEAKGSPASAGLYDYSQAEPQPRAKKGFFRTQGAKLTWNKTGTAVLVLSYADFDVTNQSYYGEQKLHYLPADPAKVDATATVALPKEGPIHDVQWSPAGDYFITVAGFMPAKVTLWDANCKPIFDFGSGPYSMARWNPFGRFLCIAGFGNLPGDILFYDKKVSGTCKQMGAVRCPGVSAEWSPDGRQLLVATTAPRLRVDNKYQVLTYYGQQVAMQGFDILFEASWLPAPTGTYQDRPQSPERLAASASGQHAPVASPAPKPAGYLPPHMRNGTVGASAPTANFSLAFDKNDKGGRIASGRPAGQGASASAAAAPKSNVPGFEFVDAKAASKNAKKRAAAAKKKAEGADAGDAGAPKAADTAAVQAAAQGVESLSVAEGGEADTAKRIRNLQKKLRQIQQLKEKRDKEGDGALEPEQRQKIASEASVVAEIQSLGGSLQ